MHRDIPFARDPSLHVAFDWGDPYWKMASVASGGSVAANAFDCALALAQLVKEARGKAWVYEFGVPGVLTHAVCVVEAAGKWWVEDPFFDTTFKIPFCKVLDSLAAGGEPDRTPEKAERICIVREGDTVAAGTLGALAKREFSAIGDLRRYAAPLRRETYLTLLDDADLLFEALEDRGLPRTFDALMLLPLRGFRDGEPLDLAAAPGDAGAWFAARLGDKRRMRREAVAQERVLARLTEKSRERRNVLQAELARAVERAEAESVRSAEIQAQLQTAAELGARSADLQAAVAAAETRAQDLERRATLAEASQARLGQENDAKAVSLQAAQADAATARDEVRQLEQRVEQYWAAADTAALEAAAAVEQRDAAEEAAGHLRRELAAETERADRAERGLEARRAALSRTRGRALAALQRAAGATRDLDRLSQVMEDTRRAADQSLDDLRRQQESEAGEAAERVRQAEAASELLRAELATLAADHEEQGLRAQAEAAAAVEQRIAAEEAAELLRQALAAESERAGRAEQGFDAKRALLSSTRRRALAALHRAAGTRRELGHLSQVLEETRRVADQSLDDLRRQQASERGETSERLRESEASSEALRAELATLAAAYEEQGRRAQADGAAEREKVKQLEQGLEQFRAAADDAAQEAAAAVELRVAAEETAGRLREELAVETERAGRAEQGLATKRAVLSRTRGRALAALQKAARVARELDHLSLVLEETRRVADRSLDDLRRRQERERGEAAERLRQAEQVSEALRADLATLAAGYEEQGLRARAHAAELQAERDRFETELRAAERANLAFDAAVEASAAREAGLVASADTLRREVSELETARRSLSLALADASGRELELEGARRALTQALEASASREAALTQDAAGLRGRLVDLTASEAALGAALVESRTQAEAVGAADRLKARVLENVVSRAAAIGDFEGDGLDPFDALERLSSRLAEVTARREALAAELAETIAEHDRRLSRRIGRMFGLVRKRPEGGTA